MRVLRGSLLSAVMFSGVIPAAFADWSQNASTGPFLYTDPANWTAATVNNVFSVNPTTGLNITFDANHTMSSGVTMSYGGSQNITFRSDGATPRTITLAGNWIRNAGSGTITLGTVANPLVLDLNGASRTIGYTGGSSGPSFNIYAKITNSGGGNPGITLGGGTGYVNLYNDSSDFTGPVFFSRRGGSFSSIKDVGGGPSALGAPTTSGNGLITVADITSFGSLNYTGTGDTSNRNWQWNLTGGAFVFQNTGGGTLTLNGNFTFNATSTGFGINASSADLVLNGVLSDGAANRSITFTGGAGRSTTLGGGNTYSGGTSVNSGTVKIGVNPAGTPSSITSSATGIGTLILNGGTVSASGVTARDILNPVSVTANSGLGSATDTGTLTIKGATTLNGAINSERLLTVNSPVVLEGVVTSGVAGAGLAKAGSSTLTLTGAGNWTGSTSVSAGTFLVSSGANIAQAGNLSVTGGTFRINSPGGIVVAPSTTISAGSLVLEAGTLRTNSLSGAAGLNWSGGTLAAYDSPSLGSGPDLSQPGGADVRLGRTLSVTGNLTTGTGTTLDLGDLYLRGATVFNQLSITGSLTVAPGTVLNSVASPYLLRGSTGGTPSDYGTLVLVEASGGITNPGNFLFTAPAPDGRPFSEFTGAWVSAGNPAQLDDNTWYLEYTATQVLFHYKVTAAIPEPGAFGLCLAGVLLLRAMRRASIRSHA